VPVLLGAIAVLVVLALPVPHLSLGTPGDEGKSTATTERRTYDALARGFGPGINGPLTIVVDAPQEVVRAVAARIAGTVIAGYLVVSPLTVRTHIQRARTKLHARDRARLVVIAYQTGLVRPTS
jgi:RND superfamily putative drug exporter